MGRIAASSDKLLITETGVHGLLNGKGTAFISLETGERSTRAMKIAYPARIVGARENALYIWNEGQVSIIAPGKDEALWSAEAVVDLGADWLVLRGDEPVRPVGFSDSFMLNQSWVRRNGATQTPLPRLDLPAPRAASMTPSAPLALLAVGDAFFGPTQLHQVNLETGTSTKMAPWHSVRYIAPDPAGWLVIGEPEPGGIGVYRLDKSGSRERILSGSHRAARFMAHGTLVLLTREATPTGSPWNEWPVYRVPAKILPDLDRALTTTRLDELESYAKAIPAEHLDDSVWRDRNALDAAIAAARAGWTDRLGPLPASPEQADDLLHTLSDFPILAPQLWIAAELLMIGALLDTGAEWIESDTAPILTMDRDAPINDHAIGFAPGTEFRLSLQESESWYRPVTSMLDRANGRTLVLGPDLRRVQQRVQELDGPPVPMRAATPAQALSWIQDHPKRTTTGGSASFP
ncbi:MAG: hypothetical protein AB8H79_04980 [Myxococcota bacterium]